MIGTLIADPIAEPLVIIIDDEPAVARALARWLQRSGIQVEICTSSVVALARFQAGERFDVVVCDGQMPGLRGVELVERARDAWPDRINFLSGGDLTPDEVLVIRERGLRLFWKPLQTLGALEGAVREIVARQGAYFEGGAR